MSDFNSVHASGNDHDADQGHDHSRSEDRYTDQSVRQTWQDPQRPQPNGQFAQPGYGQPGAQPGYPTGGQWQPEQWQSDGQYGQYGQYGQPNQPYDGAYPPNGQQPYQNGPVPPYGQYGQYNQYAPNGYRQPPFGYQPREKVVAGLLGIFLGCLGVHNFYLGYTAKAVLQLLLTCVGWAFFGLGPLAAAIWGLVEGILILCSNYGSPWHRDAKGVELKD